MNIALRFLSSFCVARRHRIDVEIVCLVINEFVDGNDGNFRREKITNATAAITAQQVGIAMINIPKCKDPSFGIPNDKPTTLNNPNRN